MRPPVIVAPWLKVDGMALFPFILVRNRQLMTDEVLIRHETIHLRQAAELLVIPFYLFYLINYLIRLVRYRDHHRAYMHIVFEREAYTHENDRQYLKQRRLWAWTKYI